MDNSDTMTDSCLNLIDNCDDHDSYDNHYSDDEMTDHSDDEMTDHSDDDTVSNIKVNNNDYDDYTDRLIQTIRVGNEYVESRGKSIVRFVPVTTKDESNKKVYIVLDNMKNQLYLKEKVKNYPSGKSFTKYIARVKPRDDLINDSEDVVEQKKQQMVDMFNKIRSQLIDQIKGYVKIPDCDDQSEYQLDVRHNHKRKVFYNIIGYNNRVYNLKRWLISHVLRDCTQSYVIHLEGLRITEHNIRLSMRLCRTMVDSDVIEQLRFHDAKVGVSEVINRSIAEKIDKIKKRNRGIDLRKKKYVRKKDVANKLNRHFQTTNTISV